MTGHQTPAVAWLEAQFDEACAAIRKDAGPAPLTPHEQRLVLYVKGGSAWPDCTLCWRAGRPTSWWAGPDGPGTVYACHPCGVALESGKVPDLPSGAELGEVWERIAVRAYRLCLDPDVVDAALADLAPHLPVEDGRALVEIVQDAVLRLERLEDPCTVLDREETGPDHNPETYVNAWRRVRDDALATLTGERSAS